MLLFCLADGQTVLHTGDFRADPSMEAYPELLSCRVQTLYLDTTWALSVCCCSWSAYVALNSSSFSCPICSVCVATAAPSTPFPRSKRSSILPPVPLLSWWPLTPVRWWCVDHTLWGKKRSFWVCDNLDLKCQAIRKYNAYIFKHLNNTCCVYN